MKCGMITNETTLHKRPNGVEVRNYRSLCGHLYFESIQVLVVEVVSWTMVQYLW